MRRTPATTGLTPAQFVVAKNMREDTLTTLVINRIHAHGLIVAHFRPVRTVDRRGNIRHMTPVQGDGAGFLDLTIPKPGGVLFRELKTFTGRLSPEQHTWIGELKKAGANVGVWTPVELLNGTIDRELL